MKDIIESKTCIITYLDRENRIMYLGGDSQTTINGGMGRIPQNPKIFKRGEFLFASSGYSKVADLIQFSLVLPKQNETESVKHYFYKKVIKSLHECFKKNNLLTIKNNFACFHGIIVCGYKGHFYEISTLLSADSWIGDYNAIGSGAQFALGYLDCAKVLDMSIEQKIKGALRCAAKYDIYVSAPFKILKQKY